MALYSGVSASNFGAYYKNTLVGNLPASAGSEYWGPLYQYVFDL